MILIGEMRDEETVHTALSARPRPATSCFSTVHTVDAAETVNRIIDFFPPHMHQQVRAMLAGTLKGVDLPAPRARPPTAGPRRGLRDPAHDRPRADMIMDPKQTGRLPEVIAEGGYYGMQTFDQALLRAPQGRPRHDGARRCRPRRSPHDFKLLVAADGRAARRWTTSRDAEASGATASRRRLGRPRGQPAVAAPSTSASFSW